jgi:hypothetical protein
MSRTILVIAAAFALLASAAPAANAELPRQDLRSPDTRDVAGVRQDLRSPDSRDAATPRQIPLVVAVKDTRRPAPAPAGGFDWAAAAAGAGIALAVILLVTGGVIGTQRRTRRAVTA